MSALFENGAYTLVVQKNGVTVHKDSGRGVGPALRVFDAQPELLKGALVCDTIVGKAAAAIYLLGGASGVYAEIMSAAAADFLIANGVDCACETKTEKLLNRQGTGLAVPVRAGCSGTGKTGRLPARHPRDACTADGRKK